MRADKEFSVSRNYNKLNIATKTGVALMAGVALAGCAADGEATPVPTVTVTAFETVTATPQPHEEAPVAEADATELEGVVVELDAEQLARAQELITRNSLSRFMEVRGDSDDMYNGFGQLMAEQEVNGGFIRSYVRFADTPDGVELSTENYATDEDGNGVWANWNQFLNNTQEAAKATEDGVLTTAEAQELLKSPATEFEFGSIKYRDGTIIQVVAEDGGVSVDRGNEADATYREYNNMLEGLTPISDIHSAEATLNTFLNFR